MAANAVTWFEIPVHDMPRAQKFYEHVLDVVLSINNMGGTEMAWFPMHPGAPNAMGSLIKGDGYTPSHAGTVVYFSVADIDAALGKAGAHGGKTLLPKTSIGQHGFIAHLEDSEGNRVALHSM